VLKQKGNYQVKYLYGGDAYFDNMQDFLVETDMILSIKKHLNQTKLHFQIFGEFVMKICTEKLSK
jgi:CO/xanthine dehydrogenase FAD-binding subunit